MLIYVMNNITTYILLI